MSLFADSCWTHLPLQETRSYEKQQLSIMTMSVTEEYELLPQLWSLSLSKPSGWTFLSNVRLWSESNLEVCFFDFICTITYVLVNCKSNYALPHSLKTLRICCVCVCVILTRYWIAQWNISKVKICYFLMHIWNSLTGYNWYINWR